MSAAQGKRIILDLDGRTARISGKDDLYQGDSYANDIVVELTRSGQPAQVSGYTASGEFERSDGVKVPCTGSLTGNVATIKLDEHCYYRAGAYRLTVRLSKSNEDITRTVLEITGTVQTRSDGPTVDVNETLVNVDAVLELYEEMKDATKNVQSATDAANNAAAAAQQATTRANNAANNADVASSGVNSSIVQAGQATANANNAASSANTAAANAAAKASQADSAAARALTAAGKPPVIDSNKGTWQVWDDPSQSYKDTSYPAQGPAGPTGATGSDAEVTAENIQRALGYVPANPANVTVSAGKITEALGYTPANAASTEQIFTELDKLENNKLDNRGLPYNRVVATDPQGNIQYLNFTEVGEDVTATRIQQALGYKPLKEITAEGIEKALGYEPADKASTDALWQDKVGKWNNTPNKYLATDSAGAVRFVDPPSGGSGGGIPPTGPYQMLVTDGDQNQVWEERTHYPYIGRVTILPEVNYRELEYVGDTSSQDIAPYLQGEIETDQTYFVTFGDEEFECLAFSDPYTVYIAENNDQLLGRFVIMAHTTGERWLLVNDGGNNPKPIIKVEGPGIAYKRIDPAKYLPEGYPYVENGEVTVFEASWTEEEVEAARGELAITSPLGAPIEVGKTYIVTWCGKEYENVAKEFDIMGTGVPLPIIGNLDVLTETGDTGEPYVIVQAPAEYVAQGIYVIMMAIAEPTFPLTVKVEWQGEIVHKMDKKFLPTSSSGGGVIYYKKDDVLSGQMGMTIVRAYTDQEMTEKMSWKDGFQMVLGGAWLKDATNVNEIYETPCKMAAANEEGGTLELLFPGNGSNLSTMYVAFEEFPM